MRRLMLLTIAMFLASPARSQDCRTISDSLLRLRCYDGREQALARSSPATPTSGPTLLKCTAPRWCFKISPAAKNRTPCFGHAFETVLKTVPTLQDTL